MKKFLTLCLMLVSFAVFAEGTTTDKVLTTADKIGDKTTEAVSAVYGDGVGAVSTVYSDAKTVVDSLYHDSKGIISTVYGDTKELLKVAGPKIEAGLIALADAFKTTVKEVIRIMVMKQIAIAISYIIKLLFGIFCLIMLIRTFNFSDTKLLSDRYIGDEGGMRFWKIKYLISASAYTILCIWLIGDFITNIDKVTMGLIAPEYGAIREIVDITISLIK